MLGRKIKWGADVYAAMDEAFENRFTPFWQEMFFLSEIGVELNAAGVKLIFGRCEGKKTLGPFVADSRPLLVLYLLSGFRSRLYFFWGGANESAKRFRRSTVRWSSVLMLPGGAHDGSMDWVDAAGTSPPQMLTRDASSHKVVRTAAALGDPTCVLTPASQGLPCSTVCGFLGVAF